MYGAVTWEPQKTIGIDFDETISDNPIGWLKAMESLEKTGYRIVVVTWRSPETYPADLQFLVDKGYKVFYTSWKAKRPYMESKGIKIDIVIDDNPWAWDNDAEEIWTEIKKEEQVHDTL